MEAIIHKLFMNLLIWVLKLVNDVFNIFRILAGLEPVQTKNGDTDLVNAFIDNQLISKIFFGILIVAVIVCGICVIVATVKAVANISGGERKSLAKISGQGLGMIFISLFMAVVMISGITVANSLLREINAAFHPDGEQTNISNELFNIAVDERAKEWKPVWKYEYQKDIYGNEILDHNGNKIPVLDANGEPKRVPVVDNNGDPVVDSNGNQTYVIDYYEPVAIGNVKGGWRTKDGEMPKNGSFNILNEDADTILGKYSKNWLGFEQPEEEKILVEGKIYWGSFNFLTGYFAAVIVLVAVCSACLGLVKRLYDLVVLFLSLPLVVATIPLDDGAKFKVWRETVVSKVILAYGAVFAVNTFLFMVPIINGLAVNNIVKMFLIVGGGLSISGGTLLFARLFGTDAAESRDMAQSARTLLAGGVAGMHGVKTALKFGGKTAMGGVALAGLPKAIREMREAKQNSQGGSAGNSSGSGFIDYLNSSSSTEKLNETMSTAGVQSGTWHRDTSTGRFINAAKAKSLAGAGDKKE